MPEILESWPAGDRFTQVSEALNARNRGEDGAAGAEIRFFGGSIPRSRFGADAEPAPSAGGPENNFEELVLDVGKTWQFQPAQLLVDPFRRLRVKIAHEVVAYFLGAAIPVKACLLTLGRALHIG